MKINNIGHPILKIAIRYEPDIVTVRQKTRRLAALLGFDHQDQARLATAVSELARNAFQYAGNGNVEFFFNEIEPQSFYVRVSDSGPGIIDLQSIINGNYVSQSGMGIGLIGSKKLMDDFSIESSPERGTQVIIGKRLDPRTPRIKKEQLPDIALQLMDKQYDSPFEEIQNQNRDLLQTLEELRVSKEELAELNRELSETNRGVVALYAELDEKAASLQKANEIKSSFLSNMTHEFRTPLSSIISLTRLLLDRVDGELSGEQQRQVHYIRQSSESLLELVNDLLDLAKVEAGKISLSPIAFSAQELLGGLRGMFRPILGRESTVDLKIISDENDFNLITDQGKISQILRNLVSNAIKFTEQGCITVSVSLRENDLVQFKVEDTGVGIPSDYLSLIFEEFGQVESRLQRRQKGTGLGLPLSRKLARLLGGDLWVESTPGVGSIFYVVIPRVYTGKKEAVLIHQQKEPLENHTSKSSHFNILLIDDDEPSRYILKNLIGAELDANFIEARSGREGLEMIRTAKPDLVFLDLTMPEMDGFEVLKQLNADKGTDKTKNDFSVIVNTAKKLTADESAFLEKEATAVISKARSDHEAALRDLRQALIKAGFDFKNM